MIERDIDVHCGCPNRHHCKKDERNCCYLVKNHCLLENNDCEARLL